MAKAHILVLPVPAQGHVTPLMELSHRLVDHGFEVTFVNTEAHHARVVGALQAAGGTAALAGIHLASIPDGLEQGERLDVGKVIESYDRHIPGHLERLIAEMEASGRPKVNWIVCDVYMWPSFVVAKKFGIRVAALWPAAAACLAINIKIPKLIKDGFVNDQG